MRNPLRHPNSPKTVARMARTLLLVCALLPSWGQGMQMDHEAERAEKRLQAVPTGEAIEVDGSLDEPAWQEAALATGFIQNEPRTDEPATEETEVRVLYDGSRLYFGVHAYDSEPDRLIVSGLDKDFNRGASDSVTIVLDTFHDERNGYLFSVNPAGAKWDAQMTNEGREINEDWDAVWTVRTRIVEDGWTAEIAVPFRSLKFRSLDRQSWGINFERQVRRRNETSFWFPLPRIYGVERVSLAGTLEGLEGISPGANFRVKPYLVGAIGQSGGQDRTYTGDFGMDAKYGITSGLTWDVTYNTDFSQVEADDQQINLTRFSLLFPEKREFFLENSGIFQFHAGADRGPNANVPPDDMLFFFSRRIGLSEEGLPLPVLGGTRLTGRVDDFELGFLNIHQGEQGNSPSTNFTVGRLRYNLFSNSDVGVMFNNKEVLDSPHYNRAFGVDANVRFNQPLAFYTYLAKTFSPLASGQDWAGRASLHYIDDVWNMKVSYSSIQEDYRDEMGFVPRVGIRQVAGAGGISFRPEGTRRHVRRWFPHIPFQWVFGPDGELESSQIDYHFIIDFQDSTRFEIGVNASEERLREPFRLNRRRNIAIPPGDYRFHESFVTYRTDESRTLSADLGFYAGPFYGGYKHTYRTTGKLRLGHRFNLSVSNSHNNINLPEGHYKTNLLNVRANYAFSTSAFLNALVQYNSDARIWNSNIRFNLIHRPLSDLFLVYNEQRDSNTGDLLDRTILAKITYMIAR